MSEFPGCNHLFGAQALREWLKTNDSCPVCRRPWPYDEQEAGNSNENEATGERAGAGGDEEGGQAGGGDPIRRPSGASVHGEDGDQPLLLPPPVGEDGAGAPPTAAASGGTRTGDGSGSGGSMYESINTS